MAGEMMAAFVSEKNTLLTDPLQVARFWSKVEVGRPGVCWPWRAAVNEHGYGVFMLPDHAGTVRSHRVAWSLLHARPLGSDERLLHSCDNPPCCNPAHLSVGTQGDNIADMVTKGRRLGMTYVRLTDSQVTEIRERCAAGEAHTSIAADMGVSARRIRYVNAGGNLHEKKEMTWQAK